jgi:hypothetical protein
MTIEHMDSGGGGGGGTEVNVSHTRRNLATSMGIYYGQSQSVCVATSSVNSLINVPHSTGL